jgi:hypothetical protein
LFNNWGTIGYKSASGCGTDFRVHTINAAMIALEFKELVEVSTPKGDGLIWYMIDYGPHSDTLYTIVMKETGECWQMTHKDFRIKPNVTMGIAGNYSRKLNAVNVQM